MKKVKRYYKRGEFDEAWKKSGGRCWYCGAQSDSRRAVKPSLILFHLDHVIPFSKGGGGDDNLRLCCPRCNSIKGDADIETFRYRAKRHKDILSKNKFYFERVNSRTLTRIVNTDVPTPIFFYEDHHA